MDKKILYSAVVLTEKSRGELLQNFSGLIPEDYKTIAHHMTIVFGQGLPKELQKYKDQTAELLVTEFGESEFAIAVKVKGFYSDNVIAHITLATNPAVGGRPVHSNDITNWKPLNGLIGKTQITLEGVVTEITN